MIDAPTSYTYEGLQLAYDHFNTELFGDELPGCLITMQRHKGAYGYFSPKRFARVGKSEEVTDEIALNPAHFEERGIKDVLSTLVHEMVHLWQEHLGQPPRRCYHNKQWAWKMREVGLVPSTTEQPGGSDTGQRVGHYVRPEGPFELACRAFLVEHNGFLYFDKAGEPELEKEREKKANSKTKYTCPACELNAWAKPEVHLVCGYCEEDMEPQDAE